jgi:hypothetical protein
VVAGEPRNVIMEDHARLSPDGVDLVIIYARAHLPSRPEPEIAIVLRRTVRPGLAR